ncbi:MAG: MFS transporter [Verrucomicrobia bacterium]|nr:MFS transporter [Verrucomicrobiota bacterium]
MKSRVGNPKLSFFALEALNSLSTSYYFFYLFFFMAREYGFDNRDNLALAALNGFVYMSIAWLGGRFGQRFGYFTALQVGVSAMVLSLMAGCSMNSSWGHVVVMCVCTLGMCFTWPNLEALVSEGETPAALPHTLGLYNMVWAAMGAIAFFFGGALLETLGERSLFWLPVAIQLVQLLLIIRLKRLAGPTKDAPRERPHFAVEPSTEATAALLPLDERPPLPTCGPPLPLGEGEGAVHGKHARLLLPPLNPRPIARAKTFLKMAWLANPFAYVAINTVVAVVPGLAKQFELTPKFAGFFCSIWFFARAGTFFALWLWKGWHYRFRWFLGAYLLLTAGFAGVLLAPKLTVVMLAQIAFGMGVGLIYYSSLFYSMDVGEAKGEHGGLHESAIGAGIFGGPAIAGAALYFNPSNAHSGAIAVAMVLLIGFAALLAMRSQSRGSF